MVEIIHFRVCAGPVLFWRYFQGLGCWSRGRKKGFGGCEIWSTGSDFVPLGICGNSPVVLPLGFVQLQERVRWGDLHHYLSSAKRMCCVSALAVSCRPETGGSSFSWQRLGTWCWAQVMEGRNTFSSNASTQWPKVGIFGLRVFTQPEQGPYSWILVSVKGGKL